MPDIFFTSPEHKQRWLTVMLALNRVYEKKLDQEYGAALYILTSSAGTWQKTESYVERDEGIHFEAMLAEVDFSGGYRRLIKLAWNLFDYIHETDLRPIDLMHLDDTNFTVALNALQIRRASLPISELASQAELYNIEMDIRNRISRESRDKPWLPLHDGGDL